MKLRDYQQDCIDATWAKLMEDGARPLIVLPTGCHSPGTKLMMFDGSFKRVEDIKVGERLKGMDELPRTVLHTQSGRGSMYRITPVKGEPFFVTGDHRLTLVRTNDHKNPSFPCENRGGEIVDVKVVNYLSWSATKKHIYKLFRTGMTHFPPQCFELSIDPYMCGLLLGDGSIHNSMEITTADDVIEDYCRMWAEQNGLTIKRVNIKGCRVLHFKSDHSHFKSRLLKDSQLWGMKCGSKYIPFEQKVSSSACRLALLAGLIDTDGSKAHGGYDYISKSKNLAEDVAFVARSLGLAAYVKRSMKSSQTGTVGEYWRVSISGDCSIIPVKLERKKVQPRKQIKSVLRTGFSVMHVGIGDYHGVTVDHDNRYLMHDFMVTHNSGKTVVFNHLADRWRGAGNNRVLILAHRFELIDQAAKRFEQYTGIKPDIEMADSFASTGSSEFYIGAARVVVGCTATMRGRRLRRWPADFFNLIIIDEAHHATAPGYRNIVSHFTEARVVGVTATPDRTDKSNLGSVFNCVSYSMELFDAIYQRGWLVPIKQRFIHVSGLDLSDVGTNWKGDDLDTTQLDQVMRKDEALHAIAKPTFERSGKRPTLVFCTSVAHAKNVSDILNSYREGCSEYIASYQIKEDGGQEAYPAEKRAREIALFKEVRRQYLCNCGVFLEGTDLPNAACIAMARPTKSRALYAQALGRGLRPLPDLVDNLPSAEERIAAIAASAKPDCIAEGQLVVTDCGLIPIELVTKYMLIWDGVDFVKHDGVICRGYQEVITYAGLTATPDHKCWTKEGWKEIRECSSKQVPICVGWNHGESVRESEGHFRTDNESWTESLLADTLHGLRERKSEGSLQRKQRYGWMQKMREPAPSAFMASFEMFIGKGQVLQSKIQIMAELRSEGNKVQVSNANCNGSVDSEESWLSSGITDRQDRQQWTLRAGQPSLCNEQSEYVEYTEEAYKHTFSSIQTVASRNKICRCNSFKAFEHWYEQRANCQKIPSEINKAKRRVWDILNCGPRHRFVVSGLIVSNCLVLDFVGNAGKHKLVYADEILNPNITPAAMKRARKIMDDPEKERDVKEAVEEAQEQLVVEHEHMMREIDVLRRKVAKRVVAEYYEVDVNPFGEGQHIPQVKVKQAITPASDKACRYVMYLAKTTGQRFDYDSLKRMDRRQVNGIISTLRRKAGVV